jgi:AraC-like DNA-binding protein
MPSIAEVKMMSDSNKFPTPFDSPGFVSESRPDIQQVRSVARRTEQPFFFARYRHEKPNLGLLEPTPQADQVMVGVELRPFSPINVFCDGLHKRRPSAGPGALALYDLRKSWSADLRDPFDHVCFYMPLSSFQDFATERDSSFVELRDDAENVQYDAVMLHLMQATLPALDRPNEVNALFLDSLFFAVRDHVAATYGTFSKNTSRKEWGLTPRQLRLVLEYIETKLCDDLTLANIAFSCAVSVSSLARGFKTAMGISPHHWVIKRRIALAQRLIYEGGTPLSEVAACCGFADQSHLTRVFTQNVGASPTTWRRNSQL